jgi:hypothetical protein
VVNLWLTLSNKTQVALLHGGFIAVLLKAGMRNHEVVLAPLAITEEREAYEGVPYMLGCEFEAPLPTRILKRASLPLGKGEIIDFGTVGC